MATSIDRRAPLAQHAPDLLLPGFTDAWTQSLAQALQLQWETIAAWQRSVASLNTAMWDTWAAHFAGGVPIDA